jgi:hypothetical protein
MLNLIMFNVVMLNVVAPFHCVIILLVQLVQQVTEVGSLKVWILD